MNEERVMKKIFFTGFLLVLAGLILNGTPANASQSPHWSENDISCLDCHITHQGPKTPCVNCHNNTSGSGYSKLSAPAVDSHVGLSCETCHDPHTSAQCTVPLVTGTFSGYQLNAQTTTFTIDSSNVVDAAWSDPATWSEKSGTDRGLIFTVTLGLWDTSGSTPEYVDYSAEIVSANATSITVNGIHADINLTGSLDYSLIYGQLVRNTIKSNDVIFSGPTTFAANDGLGLGANDSTSDGVCQGCHTQTNYWRSDVSLATHNDGQVCTDCHDHANGFVVVLDTHHPTHLRIKEYDGSNTLTCTDCHESSGFGVKTTITVTNDWLDRVTGGVTNTDTFDPQPIMTQSGCDEWVIDNADGITGTDDDYTCIDVVDPVVSGNYTCATLCHPDVTIPGLTSAMGSGDFSTAALSTLSADRVGDLDNTVTIDATRSTCISGDCTITIDHSAGTPTIIGGNGVDTIIVQYAAPGTYTVSMTIADNVNGGVNATASATAVAALVEDAQFNGSVGVVNNGDGTCTVTYADDATTGIPYSARIYWGDRTSTAVTAAELIAGVTDDCGSTVRIKITDTDHLTTNLTF